MGVAQTGSRMPSMASYYPRVAERPGPETSLHGEDACEENVRCVATLAHHH
jgi:hypothetical protein